QRLADVLLCEQPSRVADHPGALLQAPRCEGDIAGDHDVILADMLDDPIIGRVEPSADDDQMDPVPRWNPHPRVRHQGYLEPMPPRDTVDFLLHRTAIGINVYVQQVRAFRDDGQGRRIALTDSYPAVAQRLRATSSCQRGRNLREVLR